MGNSGGAATNAGIDFQQRIAALVIALLITDTKDFSILQLDNDLDIKELKFESNDEIDDLVIFAAERNIYIQAKRTLSLSEKDNSEYSSVLKQFVSQHIKNHTSTDYYVIATSTKSSRKILYELRRVSEAYRFNEINASSNPLTKAEIEVFEKTKTLIKDHYFKITSKKMKDDEFISLFKKIKVLPLDIEEGASLETALLVLLASKSNVTPRLLWESIIALCLSLAKDRLSIDKASIISRLGKYINNTEQSNKPEVDTNLFKLEIRNSFSSGKDILLVKSYLEDFDYCIVELYRFNDDGTKCLKYYDNKVEHLNGETWEVMYRASTYKGMERFIEENNDQFNSFKIAIMPTNSEEDVENKSFVKAYTEHCNNLLDSLTDPFICIQCGEHISDNSSLFIEVDQMQQENVVGLVHKNCLQPTNRVLGTIHSELFEKNKLLKNFDYHKWFITASQGNGLFNGLTHLRNEIYSILWDPNFNKLTTGSWCIKINLENGTSRYEHKRCQIPRFSKALAKERANYFNKAFSDSKKINDPWCYSSDGNFATYSIILKTKKDNETCIRCISAEPVKYTQSIGKVFSDYDNFYAPLILLVDEESGLPILFSNTIFLISNPLNLEPFIDNWHKAGIELSSFITHIINSDDEFDKLVQQFRNHDLYIYIDPILNLSGELSSGFVIQTTEDINNNT